MKTDLRQQIQEKASQAILQEKDLLLHISIRLGKTRLALMSIEKNDKVLVCYPNQVIKQSWEDELTKYKPLSDNITFTTFASLKKYKAQSFDFLIIDEIQKLSVNQINMIKTIKFNKRVGLSGTLSENTLKKLYFSLGMEVKFKYDVSDAIKDKLVKDYRIHVHYCELDDKIATITYKKFGKEVIGTEKQAYDAYCSTMEYFEGQAMSTGSKVARFGFKKYMGLRTNLLYNSPNLLKLALNVVNKYADKKCLIYTLRQEIANKLSNETYHSKNKNEEILENFKTSKSGHLSVVNCVTAGITITNLSHVILHTYESNTETLQQKIGRSMLYQFEGDMSNIHICCIKSTQMEVWLNKSLKSLEQDKIIYI